VSKPPHRRFHLVLEDAPPASRDGTPAPPVEVRLRMALKTLLRCYGLRSVAMVEELAPDPPGEPIARPEPF
jgi:hypothetical protein